MNLIFVCNARFSKGKDGRIYGYYTSITYRSLKHYLEVFDHIYIIARLDEEPGEYEEDIVVNNQGITLLPIPHFIGPWQYIFQASKVKKSIRAYLDMEAAVICRIPGTLGRLAIDILKKQGRPFAVEVAADPYDVFNPKNFKHPLALFLRYQSYFTLRKNLKAASCALYVTEKALQQRYPVRPGIFQTYASNVVLGPEAYSEGPKVLNKKDSYNLICVGSLAQMYKSPDIVILAIRRLLDQGLNANLTWLGDGKYKKEMEELAANLGLENYINFVGTIKPATRVREYLNKSDMFLIPSRTEGLPRSLIEAMAVGLPAIGTKIGGIPELLPEHALVKVDSVDDLAGKVYSCLTHLEFTNKLAEGNHKKAKEYTLESLNKRRHAFYHEIIKLTKSAN